MSDTDSTAADNPLSGLLAGKTGLVVGVANRRSIAWGIAQALAGPAHRWPSPFRASASNRASATWRRR